MRYLTLLGPVRVKKIDSNEENGQSDAGSIPRFRSQRTIALLGYLATERRAISRKYLAALFWPDEEPSRGRSNLRRELYNLAKILPGCWETDTQTVRFIPAAHTDVDIYVLQQMEAERRWQDVIDLLGGEFLEGVILGDNSRFETWLLAERGHWQEISKAVLASACGELTRRGSYADALRCDQRLIQLTPWDEEAHRQIMRLLAWTGQREAALRQFVICKQMLVEQLEIEPSMETVALFRQIQGGTLVIPPTPPGFLAEKKARRDAPDPFFVARERELIWLKNALVSAIDGQGGIVFLKGGPGRGKTALMDAFARQALEINPDLLVVRGNCVVEAPYPYSPFRDVLSMLTGDVEAAWSAGTICEEQARRLWSALPLVAQALLEHGPHLLQTLLTGETLLNRAAAAEPSGAPWLTQLQGQVQASQGKAADLEQSQLFEQFADMLRAVGQRRPLLLLLDDMQWVDAASVGLLSYLGRQLANRGRRILIVCAYRPEEIIGDVRGRQHLLAKVLGEFKRSFGDVWLSLNWADEREGHRFVNAVLDNEPNRLGERFRVDLFRRTAGHPLFTIELLRTMQERGDLIKDLDGRWTEGSQLNWQVLPARVDAVIKARIDRLEAEHRQILSIASVEGGSFTAEVVAQVQGSSQRQLLGQLSQELAKRHRLVREREEVIVGQKNLSRYEFAHVLFQSYLYDNLSAGERRLLHGEIAQALEICHKGQTGEIANQLAHHYLNAGAREKAIEYSRLAAQRAKAVYAYDEAIQHLQCVLELLEPGDQAQTRLELLEELADIHSVRVKDTQAISHYQTALELWSSLEGADKMDGVRLNRKILDTAFQLHWHVEDEVLQAWSEVISASRTHLETLLQLVRRAPQLEWVRVLTALANIADMGFPSPEELDMAEGYAQDAVELAEQLDAPEELSDALDILGNVYFLRGLLPDQLAVSRRRLALSRDPRFDNLRKQTHILWSLSQALMTAGDHTEALYYLHELGKLAAQIRDAPLQMWALSLQAICLLRLDRWEEIQKLEEKRQELAKRYSRDQLAGGDCVLTSVSGAVLALRGDLDQARVMRKQTFAAMFHGAGGSTENWGRTQYY